MTQTAERVTRLNQILAVRNSVNNDTRQSLTRRHRLLANKALLSGQARTYTPHDDDDFVHPSESTKVQVSAEAELRAIASELTRLFDINACLDWTNQLARADVVITSGAEPFVLLRDVPVTYLLFLEKQLVHIETLVRNLPLLDPAEQWQHDPATDGYKSDPVGSVKSKKVRRNHVLAPATDRHPAQVESFTEDVPIGKWSTIKYSGALPASRVNALLGRVLSLSQAVKFAREQANQTEVVDVRPGKAVFDFLFPEP